MTLPRFVLIGLTAWTLLTCWPARAAVYITEFMSANKSALNDEDGDYPDWIEVYNAGPLQVELRDWSLTDDSSNLTKWKFPSYRLLTNEFLVIFASQKDRTNSASFLHTNFKLSAKGGYLALVDKATNIVSEFSPGYPAQPDDTSFGRDPISYEMTYFQNKPTPGKRNKIGGPNASPEVVFSEGSQNFLTPFTLALSSPLAGALIRYTTNSGFPTTNSPIYSSPITVRTSMVVRARAFVPGLAPGPLRSEAYIRLATNMLSFSSDLPILVIHALGSSINSGSHRFTHMSLYEPRTGRSSVTNRPALRTISGLKTRGSSTLGLPKSSWAAEFWDEYFDAKNLSPLGLPSESDWILYAPNLYDPVLIHNPFIHTLTRGMGTYSSRTRFLEVFYATGSAAVGTNNYVGLYVLEEKIKDGKDRVDVTKIQTYDNVAPEVTGGYLFKIDRTGPNEAGLTAGGNTIVMVSPDEPTLKTPARTNQWRYLRDYFNAFSKALNSTNWRDPNLGYAAFVDADNWIDYHTIETLSGNVDALVLSCYFYKPRNGKIMYGPHWDFDRALGSTDGRDANPRIWSTGPFFGSTWWSRLFADKDFWQKWVDRWQEIRTNAISNASVNYLADSLANDVREAQRRDTAKWRNPLRGGSYQVEVNLMKAWLSNRMDFIDRQLTPPPILSSLGGEVEPGFILRLSAATNATIFYTLDGADPRAPQNDLAATAIEYAAPIQITRNTRVLARARNLNQKQSGGPPSSTPWSGLRGATFITEPVPLSISEIMYHPARTATGKTNDGDNFEFIEIRNNSQQNVPLTGVRLAIGIQFNFSTGRVSNLGPGASVVVAKSVAAFTSRYGAIGALAGEYTGNLENKGETVALIGPTGESIQQITYDNQWYPITDGFGFALVAGTNTGMVNWSSSRNWRPGSVLHGTPGAGEPAAGPVPAVVINEVLPHTTSLAALELFNPGTTAADISGWFLTDDSATPQKYRIPAGTVLSPGGYQVFSETNLVTAFVPSARGGKVYLFAASPAGQLLGYMHMFTYGPVSTSQAYARFLTAAGLEVFRPAVRSSINAQNIAPNPSPLAITEIMYHPQPFRTNAEAMIHEFVEIQNTTDQPLALTGDPTAGGAWRLSGGVSFIFPTNVVLAPHQMALVVSFDPALDLAERDSFVRKFALNGQVLLLGPYSGHLNNSNESLAMEKPVASLGAAGVLDYLTLDEVHYSRELPWPSQADGTGLSLQRIRPSGLGDDPYNWTAAAPSAGSLNATGDTDGDGLPDGWELAHQLDPFDANGVNGANGDPDGDGNNNLEEFLGGTDPRSAVSYLAILDLTLPAGRPQITFYALPGKSYTVLYSDDLKTGLWKTLQTVTGSATAQEITVEDKTGSTLGRRFYRLTSP